MMSDIGHRHIGGNLSHHRWKGNRAPVPDAPKLQRLVCDVAVAASECNPTQHILCRGGHKMPLHGGTTVWGGY